MDTTQATPTQEASEAKPEFVRLVFSLGREARLLAQPVFYCAVLSLGGALLSWMLCFYAYVFDSFKSFLVCTMILGIIAAPGAFLFWLYRSLRDLSRLSSFLREDDKMDEKPSRCADWHKAEESPPEKWHGKLRVRVARVLELWELLSESRTELGQLCGPRPWLMFLEKPASIFIIAAAFIASALLVFGAGAAVLQGLISVIL